MFRPLRILLVALFAMCAAAPAIAESPQDEVQTSWRLLDYLAVDYRVAVSNGQVASPAEYREMVEFSDQVARQIAALPATPARSRLAAEGAALNKMIRSKAPEEEVARRARGLGAALLAAYPVPVAPAKAPDVARGAELFAVNCASCHGAKGEGPSGAFAKLDPPPVAFADRARARERTPFGLYQVISQGIEGTAMQSFAALPAEDRWALAFHAGTFAYRDVARGEQIWNNDQSVRQLVPSLAALAALRPAELERRIGADKSAAVIAYLRANPQIVGKAGTGSLELARARLRDSRDAVAAGDGARAGQLALSAYLDGFEPLEAKLSARDRSLMAKIEQGMADFRAAVARPESPAQLDQRLASLESKFGQAEAALAPRAESGVSTFLGAFTILLREGIEALLVVIAMIAFLRKAGRTEAMPYIHAGWVAALVAGAGTWALATYAINLSGASRELTEGFGSLLAAVILLSVGIWMHGKSHAEEWRRYIATKMQGALSRGSAWFLFGLAFIVVYREAFETILFYAAIWTADNGATVLAGALSGTAALAAVAWVMLRYSQSLPIGQFFRYSAILIGILTVVLAGKGVGELQEAGLIGITPLAFVPRIDLLGVYPALEPFATQLAMIAALAIGFRAAARPRPEPLPAE